MPSFRATSASSTTSSSSEGPLGWTVGEAVGADPEIF